MKYQIVIASLVGFSLGAVCRRPKITPISSYIEAKYCSSVGGPCDTCTGIIRLPACIDQPGTYGFRQDCLCFVQDGSDNIAINVCSDGVVIDLQGRTLQISGPNAIGIAIEGQTNVTVKNGIIKGTQVTSDSIGPTQNLQIGVFVSDSSHVRIENMVFENLGSGVTFSKTRDVLVTDSLFEAGVTGIQAAAWGFSPDPSIVGFVDGLTIERTHIRGMTQFGIWLRANIRNVLIDRTVIDTVNREGIFVDRNLFLTEDVTIDTTRISNTGGNGIFGQPLCRNWLIKDSQCIRNGRNGIHLVGPRNLEIVNCEVFEPKLSGIFVGVRAANNVAIRSCQINNAGKIPSFEGITPEQAMASNITFGDIPLRIDNTTNLVIEDTQVASYVPIMRPTVRLEDIIGGSVKGLTVTNFGANSLSNGVVLRGSTGVQFEDVVVDFTFLPGQEAELDQANGFLFAGGNKNCSLTSSSFSSAARGITVFQENQFSGDNTGITIENCSVTSMANEGIAVANTSGATILSSRVSQCGGIGINLLRNTLNSLVRNNTLRDNQGGGIRDAQQGNNSIFSNFAVNNSAVTNNYINVNSALVVQPGPNVGTLENVIG